MCEKADGEKVGFALSVADDMLTEQRGRIAGYSDVHSACRAKKISRKEGFLYFAPYTRSGNASPFEKQNAAQGAGAVLPNPNCIPTRRVLQM